MERDIFNLSIQNLVLHLRPFFQGSDSYSRFTSVINNFLSGESKSDTFEFILKCVDHCVTMEEKDSKLKQANRLNSIFNLLFQNGTHKYDVPPQPNLIPYPTENAEINSEQQAELLNVFLNDLSMISANESNLNEILDVCENTLSYLPDKINSAGSYLSLADRVKFSTALCACFYQYLTNNRNLFNPASENEFYQEKSLLLFSCDISGIQKFIYTVSGEGVLKSLRSRSFYIDILLEHIINSILRTLGLPCSNRIYSGGGRAYLLLPNTENTKNAIESCMNSINNWLLENYDIALYIAYAYTECSAADLFLSTDQSQYNNIFIRLSTELSANKADRYKSKQILQLNRKSDQQHERECRICSRSNREIDSKGVCTLCNDFISVSSFLLDESLCIVILNQELQNNLPSLKLPSTCARTDYLYFLNPQKLSEIPNNQIVEVYHRGENGPGQRFEMGTYAYTVKNEMATFEQISEETEEIRRIAVLRADVDNLGLAFMKGFDSAGSSGYCPLLLTAALSKKLSLFFKHYLQKIVNGTLKEELFSLTDTPSQKKKLVMVYSGGDDLFLVGAWNDVIDTAVNLRKSFEKYTAGALSLSAGIGMFEVKYPLSAMAQETEELVDAAKSMDEKKDAVALFGVQIQKDSDGVYRSAAVHCYHWKDFIEKVIGEKLRLLQDYFSHTKSMESANGNAFLYRLKSYIEETQRNPNERINIARFAYLLARMAPSEKNSELQEVYSKFSLKMYGWILNAEDRQQLLTAITIYFYLKRSVDDK